jgi:hypothetical protein
LMLNEKETTGDFLFTVTSPLLESLK